MQDDPTATAFSVDPSGHRGRIIDAAMRKKLADGLSDHLSVAGSSQAISSPDVEYMIHSVRSYRQPASVFAHFHDLASARERGDLVSARRAVLALYHSFRGTPSTLRIVHAADLLTEADPYSQHPLLPAGPPPGSGGSDPRLRAAWPVKSGFLLLRYGFPAMDEEIRELATEVIIADDDHCCVGAHAEETFGPKFCSGIVLQKVDQMTRLDAVIRMVQASGRNLLSGLAAGDALAVDSFDRRVVSPFGHGAVHLDELIRLTYLAARTHLTISQLLQSGLLRGNEIDRAKSELLMSRRDFNWGHDATGSYAQLEVIGRKAMEAARAHMRLERAALRLVQ